MNLRERDQAVEVLVIFCGLEIDGIWIFMGSVYDSMGKGGKGNAKKTSLRLLRKGIEPRLALCNTFQ